MFRQRLSLPTILATLLLATFIFSGTAVASGVEKIHEFNSHIIIDPSGSMTVTETIRVTALGRAIKRGIYREFPTRYKDRYGNSVRVRFEVIKVLRDGSPEPFHIRDQSNGKAVYIGHKDRYLKSGQYTYTLKYRTDRQIGFFDFYDELYWNVTGNGWQFPIEKAGATIELPSNAEIVQYAAYTGRRGEQGQDYEPLLTEGNVFSAVTTKTLRAGEGFTVAVAWPKGYVHEPDTREKLAYLFKDNRSLVAACGGLALLVIYFLGAWLTVGRDPEKGTIIPRFEPPRDLSPASIRFLMRMGFDKKCFAAAVVNLAVKGALIIDEDSDGDYTLKKDATGRVDKLSKGEQLLLRRLLGKRKSIRLENKNHSKISKAIKALKRMLQADYEIVYFSRNFSYFVPGIVLTAITLMVIVIGARDLPTAGFMTVWLSMWTLGCIMFGLNIYRQWRRAFSAGIKNPLHAAGALFMTLFALPFFGGEIFGLAMFARAVSIPAIGIFVAALIANAVFYQLLKAPTMLGRKVMDEAEGFRMYLAFAEKDRLEILNPPEETPELFEKYLPYALALGVENQWNKKFARVLEKAAEDGDYRPNWYHSRSWHSGDVANLGSSLGGAFSGAISSSSTAPGSSSGSGGGGSSGGGGGGGGGGGW